MKRLLQGLLLLLSENLKYYKKSKYKIQCASLSSAIHPVHHSAEIPVLFFVHLPCLDDLDPGEELSDSRDADFDIEDD